MDEESSGAWIWEDYDEDGVYVIGSKGKGTCKGGTRKGECYNRGATGHDSKEDVTAAEQLDIQPATAPRTEEMQKEC